MENDVISESLAMKDVLSNSLKVAAMDIPVIILGETGAGKDVVARFIHDHSKREKEPFMSINVSGIPKDLFTNELCGHTRGAFTGADKERTGLLRSADGGTVFLDEIGDMPTEAQSSLLHLIEKKELLPVGSDRVVPFDVRIIVASNCNFEEKIQTGTFRKDLFYRISRFQISIPPLRERPEDILPLAEHFLRRIRKGSEIEIENEAKKFLLSYNWPGNARELYNVIESALVHAGREAAILTVDHFQSKHGLKNQKPRSFLPDFPQRSREYLDQAYVDLRNRIGIKLEETIKEIRSNLFIQSLRDADSLENAPSLLGLSTESFIVELNRMIRGSKKATKHPPQKTKAPPEKEKSSSSPLETEKEQIIEALKKTSGNQREAAKLLGKKSPWISEKMLKYGLRERSPSRKAKRKKPQEKPAE